MWSRESGFMASMPAQWDSNGAAFPASEPHPSAEERKRICFEAVGRVISFV